MIREKIVELLNEVLESDIGNNVNYFDKDLMKDIGLDSLQLVNFFMSIEDQYDIEIDFDEFDFEGTVSLNDVISYVDLKVKNEDSIC